MDLAPGLPTVGDAVPALQFVTEHEHIGEGMGLCAQCGQAERVLLQCTLIDTVVQHDGQENIQLRSADHSTANFHTEETFRHLLTERMEQLIGRSVKQGSVSLRYLYPL